MDFNELASPLDYHGHKPKRLSLIDPEAPPHPTGHTYFAETTQKGMRGKKVRRVPGAEPGTVAFVDFDVNPEWLYVHYVLVRRDQRGKKLMTQLLDELLRRHGDVPLIDFGEVYSDAVWAYAQRLRASGRSVRAKLR